MEFNRPVWAEIALSKLRKNFKEIQKLTRNRKIIGVVKADAYGHGALQIAKTLEEEGIYSIATASMEEALTLRESGIKIPILTLGYVDPKTLNIAAKSNIQVTMFDKNFIKRLKEYKHKEILKIHLDVDTGMGRLGVLPQEVPQIVEEISRIKNIKLDGIYTHFSSADSDINYTKEQLSTFKSILNLLKRKDLLPPIVHAANSAAILNLKEIYFNTVRPGIILYGLSPSNDTLEGFEPILSYKARTIFTRKVPKGKSISYGRTFTTERDSLLATIPVGYADGLPRALSNKGEVLIKGQRARIVGTITMDLTIIDVTNFPYIHPGNEVVIIGKQGNEEITASEIAKKIDTINYEIVTRIGKRVKRIYKDGD